MHIIGLILGGLIAAAVLIWRVRAYMQAGKAVVQTTRDVHAALRRHGWRHRSAARPMESVEDPMLIAAVVLVLSIRCDRDVTQEDRGRLATEMMRVFRIDWATAEELQGEAEFLVRDTTDYPRWAGRMGRKLVPQCSEEERRQVLELVAAVTSGGLPSERRRILLDRYREGAKLA